MAYSKSYHGLYKTAAWLRMRKLKLSEQPLCARCNQLGVTTQATVVNHIKPHKGDVNLFHDYSNIEGVCAPCHDGVIKREERNKMPKVSLDGWFC